MYHSLSHFAPQKTGSFTQALSGTTFAIKMHGDLAEVTMTQSGMTARYLTAYTIGSGNHAFGFLMEMGNHLFQAPISYYTNRKSWDMAPGYEADTAPGFFRPVTPECLQCHAGHAHFVPGTLNQYTSMETSNESITCDRCHGDVTAHLQRPSRETIINPKRLSARARDSVCEQCHLSGETRILNPGKQFADFHPGQDLEDVFSVYVRANPVNAPAASIKVISHAEQLALSTCARNSGGKLWCGTCHNPHERTVDRISYFRARCLSCHGKAITQTHAKPTDDCIACHMPKRPAKDGAHTAFTDHEITRFPSHTDRNSLPVNSSALRAWYEPTGVLAARNLGLAEIAVGERDQFEELMDKGAQDLVAVMKELPPDAVVLTKLGIVLLRKKFASDAIEVFEYALKLQPNDAGAHANLGMAFKEAGQTDRAIEEYKTAIKLDPGLESAYQQLADIYLSQNNRIELQNTFEQYLKAMPNNFTAMQALKELDAKFKSR